MHCVLRLVVFGCIELISAINATCNSVKPGCELEPSESVLDENVTHSLPPWNGCNM